MEDVLKLECDRIKRTKRSWNINVQLFQRNTQRLIHIFAVWSQTIAILVTDESRQMHVQCLPQFDRYRNEPDFLCYVYFDYDGKGFHSVHAAGKLCWLLDNVELGESVKQRHASVTKQKWNLCCNEFTTLEVETGERSETTFVPVTLSCWERIIMQTPCIFFSLHHVWCSKAK